MVGHLYMGSAISFTTFATMVAKLICGLPCSSRKMVMKTPSKQQHLSSLHRNNRHSLNSSRNPQRQITGCSVIGVAPGVLSQMPPGHLWKQTQEKAGFVNGQHGMSGCKCPVIHLACRRLLCSCLDFSLTQPSPIHAPSYFCCNVYAVKSNNGSTEIALLCRLYGYNGAGKITV